MKRKNKIFKTVLILIYSFITFLVLIVFIFRSFLMLSVNDFYLNATKTFKIPGNSDNFVAQGLCYDSRSSSFFITGYIEHKNSPIYMVKDNKLIKKVFLLDENGNAFEKHAGGIALFNNYIYVAGGNDYKIHVFSYTDIINAQNKNDIKAIGSIDLYINEKDYLGPAFISVHNSILTVGEFYREENYKTLPTHKITTSCGDYNQAIALNYNLSDEFEFGIDKIPFSAYSITSLVQGICFDNNNIYLSTSYGLNFSYIYCYDFKKINSYREINILKSQVPLFELDSYSLIRKYKIPPMSEEIEIVDNKMYIMCESASNKYIFGKFTSSSWCYALDIDKVFY